MSGLQNRDMRRGIVADAHETRARGALFGGLAAIAFSLGAMAFVSRWVDEGGKAPQPTAEQRFEQSLRDCALMAIQDGGQWPATDTCVELIEDDAGENTDAEEWVSQMSLRS